MLSIGSKTGSAASDEVDDKVPEADIWNMCCSKRKDILPLGNSSQKSAVIASFHLMLFSSDI